MICIDVIWHIAFGQLCGFEQNGHLLGAITHLDHIPFRHAVRGNVHFLAVHPHVAVVYKLAGCKDCRHEFGAVNNSIQPTLQKADQLLTRVAFETLSFGIDAAELLLGQIAVVAFQLLLCAQLCAEIRQFAFSALTVLAGAIFTTIDR